MFKKKEIEYCEVSTEKTENKKKDKRLDTIIAVLGWLLFIVLISVPMTISYKSLDPFDKSNGKLFGAIQLPESMYHFATADFLGFQPYVIRTSSMDAKIPEWVSSNKPSGFAKGDLALSWIIQDPETEVSVGDVVSYTRGNPYDRNIIVHRVKEITTDEAGNKVYIFQGDANNIEDMAPVYPAALQGKVFGYIPFFGTVITWIGSHRLILVIVILALWAISVYIPWLVEKIHKAKEDDDEYEYKDDENSQEIVYELTDNPVSTIENDVQTDEYEDGTENKYSYNNTASYIKEEADETKLVSIEEIKAYEDNEVVEESSSLNSEISFVEQDEDCPTEFDLTYPFQHIFDEKPLVHKEDIYLEDLNDDE